MNAKRQAHMVRSYDGGVVVVFDTCAFPVDISATSANNNPREYPEWIANRWGGAVPGVCFHRRMGSKMHEYIHHADSCHIRYISVNKGLVKSWLREEYVLKSTGQEFIQEAVRFRQQLKGNLHASDLPRRSCQPKLHTVLPARPKAETPLEERRRKTQSESSTIAYKAIGFDEN